MPSRAALRAENQLLKKQLADLKAVRRRGQSAADSPPVGEAQTQIAALQSDKEMLRLEKSALENRIKQLSTTAPAKGADTARIKQLQKERDDLQKQLAAANKELYSRKGKAPPPVWRRLRTNWPRCAPGSKCTRRGKCPIPLRSWPSSSSRKRSLPRPTQKRQGIRQRTAPRHGSAGRRGAAPLHRQTTRQSRGEVPSGAATGRQERSRPG